MKGLGGVSRNITDRKRLEDALRKSEELFRLAFEKANIGMCLVDLNGNITKVNSQMCQIFGYNQEELESMTVNDIAHPEDLDTSPKFIRKVKSGEIEHIQFEKRYFHKRGHIVWGQVASSLVQDFLGVPLYFISHIQDITERKRAEKALKQARDNLEQKVKERTSQLREANERLEKLNTGLQVLIEHRQEEMNRLQENIMNNVNKLVTPYLEKIDKKRIGSKNRAYLDVIASGLKELVSPFAGTLSSKEVVLSPTEIQVANLIRQGKTSKEIAYLMNVSANAITVHRYNIRRKLGLLNKKVNLMSYLQSLPE
jgi:PAS domain S-box-containing protein